MIDRIEQFFRRIRRGISRSEWAISLLGLPISKGTATEPGLVLIQVDGLSRRQMERAMERGRLPFLRRLIQRENYEPRTFYSGLPSTTPSVQGELFYGIPSAVPAFSFFDRHTRRTSTMFRCDCAGAVEDKLKERSEGLLTDGSSWSNVYSGGAAADETHFCAAGLNRNDVFRRRPIVRALTFPILHFPSVVRMIALLFVELFIALWDMMSGVLRGETFFKEFKFIFIRVFVCIGLREFLSIGTRIDIARGLPVIHMNFLGYDEQAHRRGPSSAFAHWSLRGIDRAIKNIYRAAQRSARRDYEIWIYSDHGQEAVHPFSPDDSEIETAIRDLLAAPGQESASRKAPTSRTTISSRDMRIRQAKSRAVNLDAAEDTPFVVTAMGPIGHLYLLDSKLAPQKRTVAEKLVTKGIIPSVLVRDEAGNVEWLSSEKTLSLPDALVNALPQELDLKTQIAHDLVRLAEQECAGDVILLGWKPGAPPVSFVNERGAHGGPGLDETQGFLLLPAKTPLPDRARPFVRPAELRAAALHFLGRHPLKPQPRGTRVITQRLRVMTYNVHSCRGMDGRTSPRRIARVIERYDPDIVALQELDFGRVRSQRHDQPKLIAEALGMHLQFCPTVIDQDEQYGHAILSHFPLKMIRTERLCRHTQTRHVEPRGALWVQLEVESLILNLMNTHFGLNRRERWAQATELLGESWIGDITEDAPLILCGDFNMFPRSEPYRALTRRLKDVQSSLEAFPPLNTFTTFHPLVRIDHIFVSNHFTPEKILVPRNELTRVASDHLPLIVDLVYQQVVKTSPLSTGQRKPVVA